jgi:exopolyphosphatase/guanosine-5'-triphosphate,3'-diphosphate pyrophosphatase
VQGVLRAGGFDGLETTEAGLREGVFFERLLAGAALGRPSAPPGDAPIAALFEDVRRTSVMNLAARYHVDARTPARRGARARHVRRARPLGLHDGDARERELLWAACMLHDIGMSSTTTTTTSTRAT